MQGSVLKTYRKALRMTQGQLAERLDLSLNFISMMERGVKPVDVRTEMSVKYLFLVGSGQIEDAAVYDMLSHAQRPLT